MTKKTYLEPYAKFAKKKKRVVFSRQKECYSNVEVNKS